MPLTPQSSSQRGPLMSARGERSGQYSIGNGGVVYHRSATVTVVEGSSHGIV